MSKLLVVRMSSVVTFFFPFGVQINARLGILSASIVVKCWVW